MDIMFSLLGHGYDDLEGFDSAEFVLNHSQRISVVTRGLVPSTVFLKKHV